MIAIRYNGKNVKTPGETKRHRSEISTYLDGPRVRRRIGFGVGYATKLVYLKKRTHNNKIQWFSDL